MSTHIEMLIFKAYHGVLSQEEQDLLTQWVLESPEHARQMVEYAADSRGIEIALQSDLMADVGDTIESGDEHVFADVNPDVMTSVIEEALKSRRRNETERHARELLEQDQQNADRLRALQMRRRQHERAGSHEWVIPKSVVWLGFAAILGLIATVVYQFNPTSSSPAPSVTVDRGTDPQPGDSLQTPRFAAQLSDAFDARWDNLAEPGRIEAGVPVTLASGFAKVEFAGRGVVVVEGPATFEVVDAGTLRLIDGRVVVQADSQADAFTLLVDNTALSGRGTEFGVSQRSRGEASTVVYAGTLNIAHAEQIGRTPVAGIASGQAVSLRSRQAVVLEQRLASQDDKAEYHRSLAETRLRPKSLSSSVQFLSTPPDSLYIGQLEDSGQVRLFCESVGVVVGADERALLRGTSTTLGAVPAGEPVDSYLIHIDPVGDSEDAAAVLQGVITFDRPVEAVIGSSRALLAGDPIFGAPMTAYPRSYQTAGGSPSDLAWGTERGDDSLSLSTDRKTLYFRLQAGSAIDQVRILVRSEDNP
ncbi:hypothetical protein OT109_16090 [Phycisphaeraceae bacterium D3-23]